MNELPFKKLKLSAALGVSIALLSACGSDSVVDEATDEPTPPPTVIRGVLDTELPSASLPAGSLPAIELPSASLPSTELDESPSILSLRTLQVTLEPTQEVGSDVTDEGLPLMASAEITVDEISGNINATVTATNVEANDTITMVHIHSGFAGENGGVLVGFEQSETNPAVFELSSNISDLADIAGNDLATFLAGGWYINLHTEQNPAGHLRGQVFTNDVMVTRTQLQGQQENPAIVNEEGISGVGYVTVDAVNESIVANVSVEGFVPFLDAPIGPVHLHSAFAGENGPVFLPLFPVGDSETVFRGTETDAIADIDFDQIARGGTYINVHSAANASGEVRGQIAPLGISVARTELQGQQENPAIVNEEGISGVGYVTVDAGNQAIVANVSVEGFIPFLDAPIGPVHLHNGFAGENGGVFLPLFPVGDSETAFRGTEADAIDAIDFDRIAQGGTYINVHSAANPGGEVRGQVAIGDVNVARTELQGQQENPAVINEEGVSGVGYVTVDAVNETIVANVSVEGFVPFLDVPIGPVHLHNGFAGENGGVFLPLFPVGDSETSFSGTEADAIDTIDFERIAQGGTYINVHSAANAGGEVRGQVLRDNIEVVRTELQTEQEVPAVTTPASDSVAGVGYFTFDNQDATFSPIANVSVTGFEATAVHVHRGGVAGVAGPVQIPLIDISEADAPGTRFTAFGEDSTIFSLNGLLAGAYYFNAHSAQNPAGEIRGQILVDEVRALRAELNTAGVVPPTSNVTSATGVGFITVNLESETFNTNVQVFDFDPLPSFVSLNIGGDNNTVFTPLNDESNGFFSATGEVNNLNGLLNGAYSLQANEENTQ
jgi:uncharacterized protein YunC (DUF1805 family)